MDPLPPRRPALNGFATRIAVIGALCGCLLLAPSTNADTVRASSSATSFSVACDAPSPQDANPAATRTAAAKERDNAAAAPAPANPTGFYREPGSYGTGRETVPPRYVRDARKTGIPRIEDLSWLDLGLDFRTRWEYRENDLRREVPLTDNPFLLRTRAYVGIRDILDPFRFVIEVEDARRYNGKFPKDNRDFNEFEPIQMIGEFYFKDALGIDSMGQDRPLSVRGGRLWFEKLDRRLIGNNGWRNTTNTFQGLHVDLGSERNDWQLEGIATNVVQREMFEYDPGVSGQYFFAVIGHWRRWWRYITLEPYYLLLAQREREGRPQREIHAPALRFYGAEGAAYGGFSYDVDLVYQFGDDNGLDHRAFGSSTEVGYRFLGTAWRPRASLFYGYASGDRDPDDGRSERFERFFGFARPWSGNDYFIWENFHTPKVKLEFEPLRGLRLETGYGAFWLASDRDRVFNFRLRDPEGQSGDFIGQEIDFRARYPLADRIDFTFGYHSFLIGNFVRNTTEALGTGRGVDTNFFYIEIMINALPKA